MALTSSVLASKMPHLSIKAGNAESSSLAKEPFTKDSAFTMIVTKVGCGFAMLVAMLAVSANTAHSFVNDSGSRASVSRMAHVVSVPWGRSTQVAQASSSPLNVPPSVPTWQSFNPSSGTSYNSLPVPQPYGQGAVAQPYGAQPANPQASTNGAQAGQGLPDQNRPPLPSPVDPGTAAATLGIPDGVPADELWRSGTAYFSARRLPEASAYFFKGASEGDPRAASALGNMYMRGEGVIRDPRQAAVYLERGASAGNRGAQYSLAKLYENGAGVPKSQSKAVELYTASARQGYAPAAKSLGLDYEFGRGVPHDRSQAIYWMKQATVSGDKEAQVLTAVLSNPQAPRFKNERQLAAYVSSGGRTTSSYARSRRSREYSSYQSGSGMSEPYAQTAPQQPQQPTAQDIREYNAVSGMMRQSMGFGGIFGGSLNNMLNPPKR